MTSFGAAVISLFALLGVLGVVAGSVKGCADARQSYYAAQEQCVSHGGTWFPINGSYYTSACIGTKP
jgi:hypothetical protein